jgi:hypothetical protein
MHVLFVFPALQKQNFPFDISQLVFSVGQLNPETLQKLQSKPTSVESQSAATPAPSAAPTASVLTEVASSEVKVAISSAQAQSKSYPQSQSQASPQPLSQQESQSQPKSPDVNKPLVVSSVSDIPQQSPETSPASSNRPPPGFPAEPSRPPRARPPSPNNSTFDATTAADAPTISPAPSASTSPAVISNSDTAAADTVKNYGSPSRAPWAGQALQKAERAGPITPKATLAVKSRDSAKQPQQQRSPVPAAPNQPVKSTDPKQSQQLKHQSPAGNKVPVIVVSSQGRVASSKP